MTELAYVLALVVLINEYQTKDAENSLQGQT